MTEFPEFEDFFFAVHGHRPYRWQSRLAREVKESNAGWPETIAAPTGTGKTAVIDIAVWRLAQAASAGAARTAPMRIVFAVDRRVIVDQAFERADTIACKLKRAATGPLAAMRDALVRFSGDNESPLHVEQLRGGMPREDDWARTPSQPTVLCTTVDQLGSRLLFRGYGVSNRMAPVHAGLLGEDALIILDEAHLSAAFVETLSGVARWRKEREIDLGLPWGCCLLTATPRDGAKAFHLSDEEREEDGIKKRLEARKHAVLEKINTEKQDDIAEAFAETARSLAGECEDLAPVVAVIVNRVGLARDVYEKLRPETDEEDACGAILLTGRVRPLARDDLINKYAEDLKGARKGSGPLYVVATQCVEAGADFDFHAMVTQVAPLDALIQRFGRLARAGERNGDPAPAAILALKSDIAARTDDPVYGAKMKEAWDWLEAHAEERGEKRSKVKFIDFGVKALAAKIDADRDGAAAAMTTRPSAPFLRDADVDFFSVTFPRPDPEPALELFLHGELGRASDVQIVWRADLAEGDFDVREGEQEPAAIAIIGAMKPVSGEALSVPVWAARAWLHDDRTASDIADVAARNDRSPADGSQGKPVVRLRGGETEVIRNIAARGALRPGDTIVAPAAYGGCDRFGWAPHSKEAVEDIADRAWRPYAAKRLRLRLHEKLWKQIDENLPEEQHLPDWETVKDAIANAPRSLSKTIVENIGAALNGADLSSHPYLETLRDFMERESARALLPYWMDESDELVGCVLVAGGETFSTGADDASSFTAPLSLCQHRRDVEQKARKFSELLDLPDPCPDVLGWAGRFHDDGKADERFQAYLHASVEDETFRDEILAKSGAVCRGDRGARDAAGLPEYWRHEVLSVQMAIARLGDLPEGVDPALVLWLVGTHHGHGRPFFRHEDDWENGARTVWDVPLAAAPGPHRLDFEWVHEGEGFDWAGLFVRLKRRYGYWGLAYLEAVLRLADHRASEEAADRAQERAS